MSDGLPMSYRTADEKAGEEGRGLQNVALRHRGLLEPK
jgi:hypothetical protein